MEESQFNALNVLYSQLCASYQAVDNFRGQLLKFLPLASGATILALLSVDANGAITPHLFEIGLFGALITLGLLIYEQQ